MGVRRTRATSRTSGMARSGSSLALILWSLRRPTTVIRKREVAEVRLPATTAVAHPHVRKPAILPSPDAPGERASRAMRALIDISHPSLAHVFRPVVAEWRARGHEVVVVAR